MAAILYVNGSDFSFTSTEPDLTGKAVIEISIPDGMPLLFAVEQLSSLVKQPLISPTIDYSLVIFKVTVGTV